MYSGLQNLRGELMEAAMDTTVSRERRALALDMIDEIDRSQQAGYSPKAPADGWLEEDVIPVQTQIDIQTYVDLMNRWAQGKPTPSYVPSVPAAAPVAVETETEEFEDEELF